MKNELKILFAACSFVSLSAQANCLASGSGATLQNAISAANGTDVVLCQNAQFAVTDQINLPSNTTIYTEGKPADITKLARIYYVPGSGLNGDPGHQAVLGGYSSNNVKLSYIIIDGSRTSVNVEVTTGNTLQWRTNLSIGGIGSVIDHVRVINTIGGYAISAADDKDCYGLVIKNSFIGNSGFFEKIGGRGQWADGIGLYCEKAKIMDNEIRNVTDGGITFYGGTDTIIQNNWIANSDRNGISGIVVAAAAAITREWPLNFDRSVIQNNLIETGSTTQFQVGISAGSRMWCDGENKECVYMDGLSIINNNGSGRFGYGLAVAGMRGVTFTGNNINMTRWDNPNWVGSFAKCGWQNGWTNWYVVEVGSSGNLQPGFSYRPDLTGCIGLTN